MHSEEFFAKLRENKHPVVIDLWAPWCAPCRVMEPALKQIAQKYAGQVDVWKINADDSPEVVKALKVMGIPTVLGFANGEMVVRKTGVQSLEALDILFDATLNQRQNVILPPTSIDRRIRSAGGLVVIALGLYFGQSLALIALGGILLFSAYYDRCPIFRAVAPRVMALFKGQVKSEKEKKPGF